MDIQRYMLAALGMANNLPHGRVNSHAARTTPNHTRFSGVAAQKRAARKLRNRKRQKR